MIQQLRSRPRPTARCRHTQLPVAHLLARHRMPTVSSVLRPRGATVGTFHRVCFKRLLQQHGPGRGNLHLGAHNDLARLWLAV